MNLSQTKIDFLRMLKANGSVEVTVMEDDKMGEPIQCTHWEECESLISVHGAENVYF